MDGISFHAYAGFQKALSGFQKAFSDKFHYFTEGAVPGLKGTACIASLFRNGCHSYNSWGIMVDYDDDPNNGPFKTKRTAFQSPAALIVLGATMFDPSSGALHVGCGAATLDVGLPGKSRVPFVWQL